MNITYKENKEELRLKIRGDILSTNADKHSSDIGTAIHEYEQAKLLTLDLNTAKLVDSMGLNMLLGTIKMARNKGMDVQILIASESVKRLFAFARLEEIVTIKMREKRPRS